MHTEEIMQQEAKSEVAIQKRARVQERTGLSCSGIYAEMAKGRFPKPVKLSARSVGWVSTDIDAWINSRVKTEANSATGVAS